MLARITGWLLFLLPLCALGQTGAISVRGQVLDAFTKEPLARAAIVEYGRQSGTMTGEDGFFSLNCFSDSLSIHMLGHRSKKLAAQKQPMIILLEPTSYIPLDGKNIPIVTAPGISAMYLPPSVQKGHYLGKRDLRDDRLSLQPALNRIPGVYMHSGALNTNRITIRGIGNRSRFSTTKLRAFINDIPLTSGIGETTLEDIDLSLINSVGLTKGPVSSRYGAALGGTLHLSPAIFDWKYKTNFQLGGQMGSYGLRRFTSQFNYVSKERKSRLSVNFNQLERDGYRDNNNYRRQIMSIMGHWRLDSRNKVSIYAHHINLDAQIPSSLNREDYDARPGAAAFVWAQIAGFEDSEKLLGGITHEHSFHPDSQAPSSPTAINRSLSRSKASH
ncbi:MAG: TonB-dependent receptor plug domain-containing protein [Bacteroidota bacterium]